MRENILYFSLKYLGNWDRIFDALNNKEKIDVLEKKKLLTENKAKYITIFDKNYPEILKGIEKPPFVIYYYGNLDLINRKVKSMYFNSVVNNDKIETIRKYIKKEYKDSTKLFLVNTITSTELKKLSKNIVDKNSIGILPSGIDACYEKKSLPLFTTLKKDGLIISLYPGIVNNSQEVLKETLRLMSIFSSEIFMPKVKKNLESYYLLTYCIENENKLSTISLENFNGFANNFLIKEGAKNIIEKNN